MPRRRPWWMRRVGIAALVGVVGVALTAYASTASPSILPEARRSMAPAFVASDFDGVSRSLAEYRGQVVVLNFWAAWCAPCRAEAPTLERTWQAFGQRGVVVLGVDMQDQEPEARLFIRDFGISYRNIHDPGGLVAGSYGVTGLPTTFFIDRLGRVASRWTGPIGEHQLVTRIEELLR